MNEPTKKQMAETIRQKITETIFWLQQAADAGEDNQAKTEIARAIEQLEKLDIEVADAFCKSSPEEGSAE